MNKSLLEMLRDKISMRQKSLLSFFLSTALFLKFNPLVYFISIRGPGNGGGGTCLSSS